jgi:hypothetical protein
MADVLAALLDMLVDLAATWIGGRKKRRNARPG